MAMYSAATAASRGGGRGGTGLPTATQHQEQVDLVARHLRFGRGQGGIAGGQAAVGIQAGQVRRAAALVQPAVLFGGQRGLFLRGAQRLQPAQVLRVAVQCGLGLAQRLQHGVVELGQRRIGTGFGGMDACVGAGRWQRPRDQRADRPLLGHRRAEVLQQAGGTERGTEADVRVQLGGGHANPRGGRGQLALGLAHVRATLQQRTTIAHRQRLGQGGGVRAVDHAGRQLAGGLAKQGGPRIGRGRTLRAQRRQRGFQQGHLRVGAGQLRRRAAAGLDQALGDRAAALLQLQGMLGHVQFVVGMADFQVAVGHLGHHAHLGQVASNW
ncbi:hypothetical protein G6F62_012480 [Rhizopus arrhizus]|nr:hypothetical protein G6F62_012480 [Rhizopus arrhizus]